MKPENWKKLWILTVLCVILIHGAVFLAGAIRRFTNMFPTSISTYEGYGSYPVSPNERVYADIVYVGYYNPFVDGRQKKLYIPLEAKNVLVAKEHCVDGRTYIAFTVPKEVLDTIVWTTCGHELKEFKDGLKPSTYSQAFKGPQHALRGRGAQSYWDTSQVKRGKYWEEGSTLCGVDLDTGRVFIEYMSS
jgi:hypothetical protein